MKMSQLFFIKTSDDKTKIKKSLNNCSNPQTTHSLKTYNAFYSTFASKSFLTNHQIYLKLLNKNSNDSMINKQTLAVNSRRDSKKITQESHMSYNFGDIDRKNTNNNRWKGFNDKFLRNIAERNKKSKENSPKAKNFNINIDRNPITEVNEESDRDYQGKIAKNNHKRYVSEYFDEKTLTESNDIDLNFKELTIPSPKTNLPLSIIKLSQKRESLDNIYNNNEMEKRKVNFFLPNEEMKHKRYLSDNIYKSKPNLFLVKKLNINIRRKVNEETVKFKKTEGFQKIATTPKEKNQNVKLKQIIGNIQTKKNFEGITPKTLSPWHVPSNEMDFL